MLRVMRSALDLPHNDVNASVRTWVDARTAWIDMAVKMDPKTIPGPWVEGFTLDRHTVSSLPIGVTPGGHTQFQTTRTELGELVYQLKYGGEKGGRASIVAVAGGVGREGRDTTFARV